MSWHCKVCNLATDISLEFCRSCQQPWRKVWQQPKKRSASRQRSQYRTDAKEKKDRKEAKDSSVKNPSATLFDHELLSNVPWIPTTPQTRIGNRQEQAMSSAETQPSGLPPPPVLPAPPMPPQPQSLSTEESQALTHLKALTSLGVTLPESLAQQMHLLQSKERESQPVLSHSHLNRLRKLQNQLQGLAKKIGQADADWSKFTQHVQAKVREHAGWYASHRADLVEQFQQKAQELQTAKMEVSQASRTLADQQETMEAPPAAPNAMQDVATLQAMMQNAGPAQTIQIDSAPEDEVDDMVEDPPTPENTKETEEEKQERRSRRAVKATPFPTGRSPTKVAQSHLKLKSER
eukprot:Skav236705  [mRNA]  locus=scaffold738:250358:251404:+ [translate_table: standard]